MKVLLIKAPYKDVYGPIKLAAGNYFLLGLGYIASFLKQNGHEVAMLDPEVQGLSYEACAKKIKELNPGLIGITAATPDFQGALKIADVARKNSKAFLLLGGVHASAVPEYILTKHSGVFDAICVGEGEELSLEICKFLEGKGKTLDQIDGLCFVKDGQVVKNKSRHFISDLDNLPIPARDLVDLTLYKPHAFNTRQGRTATIITSRGCPFQCTFCASKVTLGGVFRARSAESVVGEIKHLVDQYSVNHILIQDDTFTYDMSRAKDICRKIIDSKLKIEWFCFSQVTKVDEELLDLMKQAGCYSVGFGIESADKEVLKLMKKPINSEVSERAIGMAKKKGLNVQAYFVFGSKGDSKESIEKTINFACKTSPTLAFFNKVVAYPGTAMFDDYFGNDYENVTWKDFVPMGVNVIMSNEQLTKRQLQGLIYKANLKFYFRPTQLFKILISMKSFDELKAYLKGGLALILQMVKWRRQAE